MIDSILINNLYVLSTSSGTVKKRSTNRSEPRAKEKALRNTVLDTEQGHARSPGIADGSRGKKGKEQRLE